MASPGPPVRRAAERRRRHGHGSDARREGLGRARRAAAPTASPTCSTSTCTSSTRSPARRPSTACGWPVARCAGPTSPSPPRTTTSRPSDIDQPIADPISRTPGRDAARATPRSSASATAPDGRRRAGHRARHRPAARPHAAGHDDRLRRLATPRRTARSARSPSASAPARSSTCSPPRRCRQAVRRRWPSPSTARCPPASPPRTSSSRIIAQHRHRRRSGLRHRVPRRGDPRAVDGGPDDGLQHVDRGRAPRPGMIAPDETTFDYLRGPRRTHRRATQWDAAVAYWRTLRHRRRTPPSTRRSCIDAAELTPFVTWGTNPGQGVAARRRVPDPGRLRRRRASAAPPSGRSSTWA